MGRTTRNKKQSQPRPVQKISLSEKNFHWRLAAMILMLAIGLAALMYALISYLSVDPGWREIEVSTNELSCGEDFTFHYQVGASGISASAEQKAIIREYSDAAVKAYRLFSDDQSFEDVTNIYEINQHPNEIVQVDEVLYQAFELLQNQNRRELYLAPVYLNYENLFYCQDDVETVSFDPYENQELADEFARLTAFARDASSVDLELLGDGKVRLKVSEEYQSFLSEYGYTSYIDFFWMKNAFIIDYLADTMISSGYTRGIISSCDGFVRSLGENAAEYSFQIYDCAGQVIYPAALMYYTGAESIVYLHDYQMTEQEEWRYYERKDGQIRTPYIDIEDGFCKSSVSNLVAYSSEKGCSEILMRILPIYVDDTFSWEALAELSDHDIFSVFCQDAVIRYNDEDLKLTDFYTDENVAYTAAFAK
ncbi:MAG: hypothetical protein SOT28_01670 [Fusicatenibacter sp.]|nr:hypothetical protein [Lachnospiraceae bacterium]MDY2937015.1 hypothetical protein [Fusicatenibacter sp.]